MFAKLSIRVAVLARKLEASQTMEDSFATYEVAPTAESVSYVWYLHFAPV